LAKPPKKKPGTMWAEPTIDADIICQDITDDGVRHASFKGLR
jgi:hypothetical protein